MENGSVPGQLDLLSFAGFEPAPTAPPPQASPPQVSRPEADAPALDAASVSVPRRLLILDTETTGLDPETDHCLEVGAILFDVPSRQVLAQQSFLLPVTANAAEPVNHIPAAVTLLPQPWETALVYFQSLLDAAEVVVAHNAAFDRQWFGRGHLPAIAKPWLCSMDEMRWPRERQLRARPSVRDLALAYAIPVWSAHRALTDCIYLVEVFRRCEDLEQLLVHGLEPRSLFKANVSYDQRHLARDAGFRWNDPVPGVWSRRLSAREADALAFAVENLGDRPPLAS
ncbi:MAG: 3'-5' exonuclease [Synechococcus sp.]